MAIVKSVKVHPSDAVPVVPAAYLMIEGIEFSRVRSALRLHLVCYASQDERDRLKQAVADAEQVRPIMESGDPSATIPYPDKPTDAQIFAVDAQRLKAAQDFMAAHAKFEAAARVAKKIVPAQPLVASGPDMVPMDMNPSVPAGDVAALLVDGSPDIAACYKWLARQPAYAGEMV